MSNKQRFKTTG